MVIRGLTTFVARLLAGSIGDLALKHGKVKILVQVTFGLYSILNFTCSFLRTFPLLLLYMALIGILEGVWWVIYPVLVMEITGGYSFNEALSLSNFTGAWACLVGIPSSGTVLFYKSTMSDHVLSADTN